MQPSTKWLVRPACNAVGADGHNVVVAICQQWPQLRVCAFPFNQHRVCVDLLDFDIIGRQEVGVRVRQVPFGSKECVLLVGCHVEISARGTDRLIAQECARAANGCVRPREVICIVSRAQ